MTPVIAAKAQRPIVLGVSFLSLGIRAGHHRLPETDAVALADHEHLVEDHFRAHVRRYLFYLEFFAGGDLVLLATGFYDRVHEWTPE